MAFKEEQAHLQIALSELSSLALSEGLMTARSSPPKQASSTKTKSLFRVAEKSPGLAV